MNLVNDSYFQFSLLSLFTIFYSWYFIFRKKNITNALLIEKLKNNPIIVDVRNPEEVKNTGLYPNAQNIPLNNLYNKAIKNNWKKDSTIIVYCASGMRSSSAASILKDAGFTDITNAGSFNKFKKTTGL